MTIIIPPGYTNVAYRFSLTGDLEEMMISLGVYAGSALSVAEIAETAYTVAAFVGNPFHSESMLAGWTFKGTTATQGTAGDPLVAEWNQLTAGNIQAAGLPNNCAHLVSKRTALGGRANRGRMYPPAFHLGESSITPNGTFVENLATVQSYYTEWFIDLVGADMIPVLFHSAIGATPTVIQSLQVDSRIATQRRRLR